MKEVRRRLERLEAGAGQRISEAGRDFSPRQWERLFLAHENARREIDGLQPLPDPPYTEENREDDQRTLEEIIPSYRSSPAWRTEEAQAFLGEWERELKEHLLKGTEA